MLRNEKKYLVPNHLLDALRNRMEAFVRPDIYSRDQENGIPQYTVRSIYFDNRRLDCYHEKLEGIFSRRKFRVRGYQPDGKDTQVVLEVKRKIENRVKKHRAFVKYNQLDLLLSSGDIGKYVHESPENVEDARSQAARFMYHVKKKLFVPTCLVTYEREAYHGRLDPGVRVTFDKNIRSLLFPNTAGLFMEEGLKPVFPSHFVLEIKYFQDEMPRWAKSVVQEFRLRNDALSKYARGIDVHDSITSKTF